MAELKNYLYTLTTEGVEVSVRPEYLVHMSQPDEGHYMWAYHVTILNRRFETIQLMSRYWKIIDANGHIVEVEGEGVLGIQPVMKPGETFTYSSGTPLATPSGMMIGHYTMHSVNNAVLHVTVPSFSLDSTASPQNMH